MTDTPENKKKQCWTYSQVVPTFLITVIILLGACFLTYKMAVTARESVVPKIENSLQPIESKNKTMQQIESKNKTIAYNQELIWHFQGQLMNPELDEKTRFFLKARIDAAKNRMKKAD